MTSITDSILDSVKKMHGIDPSCTDFDVDLILFINSSLATVTQHGAGPQEVGFKIEDNTTTWKDFEPNVVKFEWIPEFVYLDTKLVFDPPLSSVVSEAMKLKKEELLWRIMASAL